jgi:putative oxidoreductase
MSSSLILFLLSRILLASYFLKAGINNAFNLKHIAGLLKSKKIPFPTLGALAVVVLQIVASLAIILNIYTLWASLALIIFTLFANFLICNYWTMEGVQKRNVSFIFYANISVVGGLLLLSVISLGSF